MTVNAVHPGPVRSGFGMDGDMGGLMGLGNRLIRPFEISPSLGAKTSVYLATSPEVEGETGRYWVRRKPGHMSPQARSNAQAQRLWSESERLLSSVGFTTGALKWDSMGAMPQRYSPIWPAAPSVFWMGFGAMQLPGPGVFGPPKDHAVALAVIRRAVEAGVNHIDTAQFYGPDVANELLHEALYPYPDDLVLRFQAIGAARNGKGEVDRRHSDPRICGPGLKPT